MPFYVQHARAQFPSLSQRDNGQTPIYLDNPAGTQVPQQVIDAVVNYYQTANANDGGAFLTSQRTSAMKQQARETLAAFLNAGRPEEIVFAANMTTHTFNISRAIAKTLKADDEIILTQMDHDANITPWVLMAEDVGAVVRWVVLDPETGQLDMASYDAALNEKTKWVCVGHAANALGTINPIKEMARKAHATGARIYVDAVQSAPHLSIDVQDLDVDFLVCSAYKFFGPHIGVLYGKYDLLERLPAYKVAAAYDESPEKWETGTKSYETIAGTAAAVQYLAAFGEGSDLRSRLETSYAAIWEHEADLVWRLIDGLQTLRNVEIRGIVDRSLADWRVPTVVFRLPNHTPDTVAEHLAHEAIYVWSGHYYALETMQRLGHETDGGMVRIGIAHYNTVEEIDRTLKILQNLVETS